MSLHKAKKEAILQAWNCVGPTDSSLQNIDDLTDGKKFSDLMNSVSLKGPTTLVHEDVEVSKVTEDKSQTKVCETQTRNSGGFSAKVSIVTEDETRNKGSEIQTTVEISKVTKNEMKSKVSEILTRDSGVFSEDVSKVTEDEAKEAVNDIPEILKDETGDAEYKADDTEEVQSMEVEDSNSHLITMRYKSVKRFIDEKYQIHSEEIISYDACMKSNELELAKVAVLLLSFVVKTLIDQSDRVKLDTLTHINFSTQEDIQECLSTIIDKKITKKILHKLLTKPAKYKSSPRKSPRGKGPQSKSSQIDNEVSFTTTTMEKVCLRSSPNTVHNYVLPSPAAEEVYSNSPLKRFFDSPQFQNLVLVSKNDELLKTRSTLNKEMMYSDNLQIELDCMKKKSKLKDKECQNWKSKYHDLRKEFDNFQSIRAELDIEFRSLVKSKEEIIKKLESANKSIEELENQMESMKRTYEDDAISSQNHIKLLEQQEKQYELQIREYNSMQLNMKQREMECIQLKQEIESVKNELQLERDSHICTKDRLNEKMLEAKPAHLVTPTTPGRGEILGNVIEEENKILRELKELQDLKISEAQCIISKLMKERGDSDETIESVKMRLNAGVRNESDMSAVSLIEASNISRSENILCRYVELENSNSPSTSNDCERSSAARIDTAEATPRRPKRKSKHCENADVKPVISSSIGLGSLWAQCNDLGSESDTPSSNSDSIVSMADVLEKLGFSKDDYSTKVDDGKKIINSLRKFLAPGPTDGIQISHGQWDKILNCDEDSLLCLYYCKEAISRHLISSTSDFVVNQRSTVCVCDCFAKNAKHLGKLTDELSEKEGSLVSQMEEKDSLINQKNGIIKMKTALIEQKDALIQEKDILINEKAVVVEELKKKLQTAEQQIKKILKYKENIQRKNQDLSRTAEDLKAKLAEKTNECSEIKKNYDKLFGDKNRNDQIYRMKQAIFREQTNSFAMKEKEFKASIQKEKDIMESLLSQLEEMRYKINALKGERGHLQRSCKNLKGLCDEMKRVNKNLEYSNSSLTADVKKLKDYIKDLKEKNEELTKDSRISANDAQNNLKINIEINQASTSASAPDQSHPSKSQALQNENTEEAVNESFVSNSVFNRSIHHSSLMLPSEDEAGYMSHSSLEEIQRPEPRVDRVFELQRRNTMYLPHMKSSYPIEVESLSPVAVALLKKMQVTDKEKEEKALTKACYVPTDDTNARVLKKRKIAEMEARPNRIEQGGSSRPPVTPKGQKRTFRTPSSLKKLLSIRQRHRPGSNKP